MRKIQALDHAVVDEELDSIQLGYTHSEDSLEPTLAMRREGIYVTISASIGPLEIALRPRYEDLARTLSRLQSVEGLHITRQVGTAQAYLAMGLSAQGSLLLRPTIVADATGHMSLNLEVSPEVRTTLFNWLKIGS